MAFPRRVMHVLNGAGGGAALSTLGLIRELRTRGVTSSAVCHQMGTADERKRLEDAVEGRVEFVPLYWWNEKIRAAAWKRPLLELRQWGATGLGVASAASVARAARRFGAELVHTNTILTLEGGRAARLLGLPHVWHLRELIGKDQPFRLPLEGAALGRYLEAHASLVIANSNASAAGLSGVLGGDRLEVIPNGVELSQLLKLRPFSQPRPVVVMLANLSSRTKQHALFVEAARALKGRAVFRIYGQGVGTQDGYVQTLERHAGAAGVELPGFVPPEKALEGVDVLVQPAHNESFGRTVIEAMAAGIPVVGAAGGGVGELVDPEQTGLLFAPGDAGQLARQLERLLADPALKARLGANGRKRAVERYGIEACAGRVLDAYLRAMKQPLRAPWEALAAAAGLA